MKKLGTAIFFIGLLGFITFLTELDIPMMFLTLFIMSVSYYIIKNADMNKKVKKVKVQIEEEDKPKVLNIANEHIDSENIDKPVEKNTSPNKSNLKTYTFRVVGISKKDNEGKDIQKKIREFVKEELEYMDKYEGYTNKEILEYDMEVYEVDLSGYSEIALIPEPDNPYDSNAIKVIHEYIGHVGYVPRENIKVVKSLLDSDFEIYWKLLGGKVKYVDYDEYKVKIKTLTYGIEIELIY